MLCLNGMGSGDASLEAVISSLVRVAFRSLFIKIASLILFRSPKIDARLLVDDSWTLVSSR